MPRPHSLNITFKPLQLIICVALGLWLGAVAIALSLWLAWQLWPEQVRPVAQALAPAIAAPAPDAQAQMFERYNAILQQQEQQQAQEPTHIRPRTLNNPACQFWLQQDRTAPSDKSQANVLEHCYRP
ncbi:MAG TPA: hypothetical protein VJS90_19565 [Pseudomonas sp.]|uniref:hypothetical protein n=1 Tax=Pseudomonas sp. TaxID=306 RepID=UPI002B49768B|nr:hypothetical protein [Pseudomonas sp.]HKS15234.1 hypothetical protein [Pseudomonas sp.]